MGSYKALYRKYRPTSFKTVVGQDYIIRTLKNSIAKGHISHAYLFTGPRGVGKTTVARIFAKAINCTNRIDDEACEMCDVCRQTNSNSNPDIIEINASNQTGVNDMRELLDKVVFLPTISKYKVYIIDEVHMLSQSSFNALLKTLEEPPKHAIFILCTTEVEKVIPTIRSRCQRYDFHLIEKDVIIDRLDYVRKEENIDISFDALSLIADASEGGMRDALSLLDQVSSFSVSDSITKDDVISVSGMLDFDSLLKISTDVLNNSSTEATLTLDNLIRSGKEVEKITSNLINFYKDILIIKNTSRKLDKVGYDRIEFKNIINEFTNKQLFNYIDILSDASRDYRYSLDKRLYLELALIKMCDNKQELVNDYDEKQIKKPVEQTNVSTKTEYNPSITYTFKREETLKREETPSPITPISSNNNPKNEVEIETKEEKKEDVFTLDGTNDKNDPFMSLFNNVGDDSIESDSQDNNQIIENNNLSTSLNEDELKDASSNEQLSLFNDTTNETETKLEETKEEPNLFSFNFEDEKKEEKTPEHSLFSESNHNEEIKEENISSDTTNENEANEESIYDIHYIEKILNNADKPFKERTIVALERAIRESRGTEYHKYALLLDGVTIAASSKEAMVLVFNEVGHCNLIMKEENIKGVHDFFQKFLNIYISFIAIPFDYWNTVSTEFVNKFKANKERNLNNYITLTPYDCPGLKINVKDQKKKEEEDKFKDIEDMFSDIIS